MLTPDERRARQLVLALNSIQQQLKTIAVLVAQGIEQQKDSAHSKEPEDNNASHPPVSLPIQVITEPSDREKATRDAEQCANYRLQQKGIWIQGALCFITLLAFGAAAYYAMIADDTLKEAQVDSRPWIKLTDVSLDPTFSPETPEVLLFNNPGINFQNGNSGLTVRLNITVSNIGKRIAKNIDLTPLLIFEPPEPKGNFLFHAEHEACESTWISNKANDAEPPFAWSTIFPGDKVQVRIATIGQFRPKDIHTLASDPGHKFVVPYLVICIGYQYPRPFKTEAVFYLQPNPSKNGSLVLAERNYQPSEIQLRRDEHYEYAQ